MRKSLLLAVLLHCAYWILSLFGAIVLTGGGHASYVAIALLWNFATFGFFFGFSDNVTFFLFPSLNTALLLAAWIVARRQRADRRGWTLALPALQLAGALGSCFFLPRRWEGFWFSLILCLGILGLFWWCYFKLLFPSQPTRSKWERLTIA